MKKSLFFFLVSLFFYNNIFAQLPQVFLIDAKRVDAVKKDANNNAAKADEIKKLARQADKLLPIKFGTVMDKKIAPPCGNMHEYFSLAKYFWPDPAKPDGKPYIRKDGQKNPENDMVSDDKNFDNMISAVNTLSWAYYFTNQEKYATKSIELLHQWFLDSATYMLPNLNHSQMRTGIDTGNKSGIIDTHELPQIVDAVGLLRSSSQWTAANDIGMKKWFSAYLQWMRTSKNGKSESTSKNNHGTFYDLQIVTIALFCGETKIADNMLKSDFLRLAYQVEPDGKQPLELERTLALSYSTFNLEAWSMLATAASTRRIDFWNYQTNDGRSLKKAIDFLIPFVTEDKKWEYKQIGNYKKSDFYRLLLIAADKYKDNKYLNAAQKIKDDNTKTLVQIFYE